MTPEQAREHIAKAIRSYYPEFDDRGETDPWPADYNLADHLMARGIRAVGDDAESETAAIARLVHVANAFHGICDDHAAPDFLDDDVAAFLHRRGLRLTDPVNEPDPEPYAELLDALRQFDFTPLEDAPGQLPFFEDDEL